MFKFFKILVLLYLMNDDIIKRIRIERFLVKILEMIKYFSFFFFVLLCSFIKGFIYRLELECDENKYFI